MRSSYTIASLLLRVLKIIGAADKKAMYYLIS